MLDDISEMFCYCCYVLLLLRVTNRVAEESPTPGVQDYLHWVSGKEEE